MHPVFVKFGQFTIYSYGTMVALGFGLAMLLIYRQAPKFNLDKDRVIDLGILILVAGIVGARLLYILLNLNYFIANPLEIPNLSKGGLAWYGAFFSAFFAALWYIRKKALNFWTVSDLIAPYIALAQSLGRIGCFLNGCCYGIEAPAGYVLGIVFPQESVTRHPTQIYSSIALFLIFVILRIWQDRRHFNGEIFLGYCILYSSKRFLLEFLRGDNPHVAFNLTLSQLISVIVVSISIVLFAYKAIEWKKRYLNSK